MRFRNYFPSFYLFYNNLKGRLFLFIALSVFVGLADGFGLTMFLPLIKTIDPQNNSDDFEMGNLEFIPLFIRNLGLEINLPVILVIMITFFLIKGVITFFTSYYQASLQKKLMCELRVNPIKGLNDIPYKFFISLDQGKIQNILSGETERIFTGISTYLESFSKAILTLVYISFAFFIDFHFSILIFIGGLLTSFLYKILYKNTKGVSRKLTLNNDIFQGQINQFLRNFKYLKATDYSERYTKKILLTINDIENTRMKIGILKGVLISIREPLIIIIIAIVIYLQVIYLNGFLSSLLISMLFFYRALTSLTNLQNNWNLFLAVSGSFSSHLEFMTELKNNRKFYSNGIIKKYNVSLDLQDIRLSLSNQDILKKLNLKIKKNETIAIIGESGSGKTTLINLISGLFTPSGGKYLIDNKQIKNLKLNNFQKGIGYISQEPVIFSASIYDNVTLWSNKNKKNLLRFNEAIKKAHLTEFVSSCVNKENTLLGNEGLNLSGGQKQRISIARELYKKISLLILDEATSSLDIETEQIIQNNINALKGKLTIIIVAHRFSTIKNADRIIQLKNGKINFTGNFEEHKKFNKDFPRMASLKSMKS